MNTLYHFPRSLSSAAVQAVLEVTAPVNIVTMEFSAGQFSHPTGEPLHLPTGGMGLIGPVRSCPTYTEDGPQSLTMIQCAAILERVCDLFDPDDRLRPPADTAARARHLSLMVFAEATFFPVVQFLRREGVVAGADLSRETMRRDRFKGLIAPYLLQELGDQPYLCGDAVSACDFLMGMPCLNNAYNAGVVDSFPRLGDYFERLRARPSFATAHGNPDDQRLAASLGEMAAAGHTDGWDFKFRAPHERT
ncbi:MAG: glutathione S-transferase family protein [Chromatiales bacterium]|jgi:glutathione S-transferase|nr:glutathione S-transferase family protein [Chromatiales bacterium]